MKLNNLKEGAFAIFTCINKKAPCTSSPCLNGGDCSDTTTGPIFYTCDCDNTYGYNGTTCQIGI